MMLSATLPISPVTAKSSSSMQSLSFSHRLMVPSGSHVIPAMFTGVSKGGRSSLSPIKVKASSLITAVIGKSMFVLVFLFFLSCFLFLINYWWNGKMGIYVEFKVLIFILF